MRGMHVAASALAIAGEAILLSAALRWSNVDLSRTAALTLAVIIFQALLGMWTVTWLLKPIVVMGHLLGGLTTFALLLWMAWRATHSPIRLADALALRRWVMVVLALLAVQIALGGWTSANYARSEEHTSELQSLMRISSAVFCLKKKNQKTTQQKYTN